MKREELVKLSVPKEAIDKIMKMNGIDIEKIKTALTEKEKELTEAQNNLEAANKQIRQFKSMDIESIQQACDAWKQKAEKAVADKEKFIHESRVAWYVKGLKLKDEIYENHVTKMLLDKGLKFEGDKLIGADEVVNLFKEAHPDAFQSAKTTSTFVAATGTSQKTKLTKEDFRKKGYQDRLTLKSENPELYEVMSDVVRDKLKDLIKFTPLAKIDTTL